MYAPFLLRLKAFLIDYLVIVLYLACIVMIAIVFPFVQNLFIQSYILAQFIGFIIVTLPVSIYFIFYDSILGKQSLGKKRVKIKVVNKEGLPLSIMQAICRTILKFLPWELAHFLIYRLVDAGSDPMPFYIYFFGALVYGLIIVYVLMSIFTKRKQSLYDFLSKTYVIRV